jgi:hypothetical protein
VREARDFGLFQGENLVSASVRTNDGDAFDAAYFSGGIIHGSWIVILVTSRLSSSSPCAGCFKGNPRYDLGSDVGGVRRRCPSQGTSFLEQVLVGGVLRWSGMVSSASKMASLGGMV